MKVNKAVGIAPGIFWLGGDTQQDGLSCNAYLLVDNEEAVLIDPGSVLDFQDVYRKIIDIISIEQIKWVILHHQDPDLAASVPLFEKIEGANFKIVTHFKMICPQHGSIIKDDVKKFINVLRDLDC